VGTMEKGGSTQCKQTPGLHCTDQPTQRDTLRLTPSFDSQEPASSPRGVPHLLA